MRRTIVFETEAQSHVQVTRGPTSADGRKESFYIDFDLPESYFFDEPHCARLGGVRQFGGGVGPTWLVYTNFTEPQTVNGLQTSYLGTSQEGVSNQYIPISANNLPQFGRLIFETHTRATRPPRPTVPPKLIIWLNIVPTRLVEEDRLRQLKRNGAESPPAV